VSGALNHATRQEEIIESITCASYIGYPRTSASSRTAQQAFDKWEEKKDEWR